ALELPEGDEKRHYQSLLDFITPIIKAYCSDMGFKVCETAIQCLGGYGYCKEYHVEQYLRDTKIASIYEGTNGIQSIDLMGRKMRVNDGALFKAYLKEIRGFCEENRNHPTLDDAIGDLSKAVERLAQVAGDMSAMMQNDPLQWASHTYPVLLCFGDVTICWRLLDMGATAQRRIDGGEENDFYLGKIMQATYYAGVTLPVTIARLETIYRKGREVVEMPEEAF
ncbi:MAG: acyl-CoA dehydrogenase, partial [Proteobacteria bacterium]|nr:acyl-CoA dehydrogenase [Pseudomonadota bacterium]